MSENLTLVSFDLCPYVQRAAIVMAEKGVAFRRVDIDLGRKPEWFLKLSPRGKVPLLLVGEDVLFESAAIVEYLDETLSPRLHPADPLVRARHRAWMEFGSAVLGDIWTVETATDPEIFARAVAALAEKFGRVEAVLGAGPFFQGKRFGIVDAVFAPAFRYFDVLDGITDLGVFDGLPKVAAWRRALAQRASVRGAVAADYPDRLLAFLRKKDGALMRQRLPSPSPEGRPAANRPGGVHSGLRDPSTAAATVSG